MYWLDTTLLSFLPLTLPYLNVVVMGVCILHDSLEFLSLSPPHYLCACVCMQYWIVWGQLAWLASGTMLLANTKTGTKDLNQSIRYGIIKSIDIILVVFLPDTIPCSSSLHVLYDLRLVHWLRTYSSFLLSVVWHWPCEQPRDCQVTY